jgi:hypothetical protein
MQSEVGTVGWGTGLRSGVQGKLGRGGSTMPEKDSAGLAAMVAEEGGGVSARVTSGLAAWGRHGRGGARTGNIQDVRGR